MYKSLVRGALRRNGSYNVCGNGRICIVCWHVHTSLVVNHPECFGGDFLTKLYLKKLLMDKCLFINLYYLFVYFGRPCLIFYSFVFQVVWGWRRKRPSLLHSLFLSLRSTSLAPSTAGWTAPCY